MIDIVYKRPWLTLFGINLVALLLFSAIIASWAGDASLLNKGLLVSPIGALIATNRLSWGWRAGNQEQWVWRKRYLQAVVMWAVVFIVLAFILLGMH